VAEADVLPLAAAEEERTRSRAGDKLRAARERLGIDRGEVSVRTKINERHLAAVEDSDFAALPARIYAVGFARSYAGAVGLDAGAIAAQVRRELNEQEAPANVRPAYDLDIDDPAKIPSKRLAWIAAALAIALIAAGAVFWRSYFVPAVDLPPVRDNVTAAAAPPPELSPSAMISPTAESAVPAAIAGAPVAAAPTPAPAQAVAPPPPARSAARPSPRPATAVTAEPAPPPIPDRVRPQGVVLPAPTPSSSPATAPAT
jgi:cytoskeletal protein RodZ